jgi:preprotein translocase subunit SecG
MTPFLDPFTARGSQLFGQILRLVGLWLAFSFFFTLLLLKNFQHSKIQDAVLCINVFND